MPPLNVPECPIPEQKQICTKQNSLLILVIQDLHMAWFTARGNHEDQLYVGHRIALRPISIPNAQSQCVFRRSWLRMALQACSCTWAQTFPNNDQRGFRIDSKHDLEVPGLAEGSSLLDHPIHLRRRRYRHHAPCLQGYRTDRICAAAPSYPST